LRADEKRIRAQSTILEKAKTDFAFLRNRVSGTDTLFIRTRNTVGARSAQWPHLAFAGIRDAGETSDSLALRLHPSR
jgi:hypothetical protein